ncbi:MAG: hypothetical protein M3014_07490 [Chloroflexota bacterium]|nr:hypothetical protein [Chloroflexota bacterium]
MYVQKKGPWNDALRQTLQRVYDPTTRNPVPWLLTGEAAQALQGVNVEPETLDFRAISQFGCVYFAQFMKPHEAPDNATTIVYRRGGNMAPSDNWRSNVHQRIVAWSVGGRASWLGRWYVDGLPVQVSHVRTVHPDPVGAAVREHLQRVRFGDFDVAVVPIEFMLAESALRGIPQASHRILHALRISGYDAVRMQTALATIPREKAYHLSRLLEIDLVTG